MNYTLKKKLSSQDVIFVKNETTLVQPVGISWDWPLENWLCSKKTFHDWCEKACHMYLKMGSVFLSLFMLQISCRLRFFFIFQPQVPVFYSYFLW